MAQLELQLDEDAKVRTRAVFPSKEREEVLRLMAEAIVSVFEQKRRDDDEQPRKRQNHN